MIPPHWLRPKSIYNVFLHASIISSISLFCFPLVFASQVVASDKNVKIHVKKGRTQNYYHLEYILTADNLIMSKPKSELMLVNEGGHFVVNIKKDAFPVQAPACDNDIILDMPLTKSTRISALKKINKKMDLYYSLLDVANGAKPEQKIVIELNPHVKVLNKNPIELELTKCNVYFRTARDAYIDYIGRLKR